MSTDLSISIINSFEINSSNTKAKLDLTLKTSAVWRSPIFGKSAQKLGSSEKSKHWNIETEFIFSLSSTLPQIPWSEDLLLSLSVSEHDCGIRYLEHVQVQVDLMFPRRGYLEMSSVSPSETRSRLLYPRVIDSITSFKYFRNWTVTSLHYWGENPVGKWKIIIRNTKPNRKTREGRNRMLAAVFLHCVKTIYLKGLCHRFQQIYRKPKFELASLLASKLWSMFFFLKNY